MKAMRFHEYGDADVLRYEDVDAPAPSAGEVRSASRRRPSTRSTPVSAPAAYQGPFPVTLPHMPGVDVAGTVEALGDGVTGRVGDEVVGFLPISPTARRPSTSSPPPSPHHGAGEVPLADAAALPTVGLTAWQALFEHGGLKAGQRVLINGAGGAVGSYAVQLAKQAGAT